jgi:hypothetical protein
VHDRHIRFRLPDPVLQAPGRERVEGAWLSHGDPETSTMMQIPQVGQFLRALLPIRLTGGFVLTYGLWVLVRPADLQRAFGVWWQPDYQRLRVSGWLANAVPPWNARRPGGPRGTRPGTYSVLR